jgi:hypothetical protein
LSTSLMLVATVIGVRPAARRASYLPGRSVVRPGQCHNRRDALATRVGLTRSRRLSVRLARPFTCRETRTRRGGIAARAAARRNSRSSGPVSFTVTIGSPGLLVTLVSRHFRFAAERASVTVEESHDDRVAWGRV